MERKDHNRPYVENYQYLRLLAREFYLRGDRSKEALSEEGTIQKRNYDEYKRRILGLTGEEFIQKRRIDGKQTLQFGYNPYHDEGEFLFEIYKLKKINREYIGFYLCCLILLKEKKESTLEEILDMLPEALAYKDYSTYNRYIERMVEAGILRRLKKGREVFYSLGNNPLDELDPYELRALYRLVDFFRKIRPRQVEGCFLGETLKRYIEGKDMEVPKTVYQRFSHIHPSIEEELISIIENAISERKLIKVHYRKEKKIGRDLELFPVRQIFEGHYGRWYLLGLPEGSQALQVFRIDRIFSIEILQKEYREDAGLQRKSENFTKNLWNAAMAMDEIINVEIEFRKTMNGKNLGFVKDRVLREAPGGRIIKEDKNTWIYRIQIRNEIPLIPWIRGFGEYARVLPGKGHQLEKKMRESLGKAVAKYEPFSTGEE